MINILDFGADVELEDNSFAFKAAINAAAKRFSTIIIPSTREGKPYKFATSIPISNIYGRGIKIEGDGMPELCYTGSSGNLFEIENLNWFHLNRILFSYSHPNYRDNLIQSKITGSDSAYLQINDCMFDGAGGAKSFINWDGVICSTIRNTLFSRASTGIILGEVRYANVITIDACTFNNLGYKAVLYGGCRSLRIVGCAFEPNTKNQCCGVGKVDEGRSIWALDYSSNWHGDVSIDNGGTWLDLKAYGASITANCFDSPGIGPNDCCIHIRTGSEGIFLGANRFSGVPVRADGNIWGFAMIANDAQTLIPDKDYKNLFGIDYLPPTILANHGQINQRL